MSAARYPIALVLCCLWAVPPVAAQDTPATPVEPKQPKKEAACKADGWLAALDEAERTAFKKLGWCPEDQEAAKGDKSSFATPIDLEVGPKLTLKGAQIFPQDARNFFAAIDVDSLWEPGSTNTYRSSASIRP